MCVAIAQMAGKDYAIASFGKHVLYIVGIAASAQVARVAALRIIADVHDHWRVDAVRLCHRKTQAVRQYRVGMAREHAVTLLGFRMRPRMANIWAAAGVDARQKLILKAAEVDDCLHSGSSWRPANVGAALGAALPHVT